MHSWVLSSQEQHCRNSQESEGLSDSDDQTFQESSLLDCTSSENDAAIHSLSDNDCTSELNDFVGFPLHSDQETDVTLHEALLSENGLAGDDLPQRTVEELQELSETESDASEKCDGASLIILTDEEPSQAGRKRRLPAAWQTRSNTRRREIVDLTLESPPENRIRLHSSFDDSLVKYLFIIIYFFSIYLQLKFPFCHLTNFCFS